MTKKLQFKYGCVGSAKTLELLRVSYNYNQQNKKVILIKPEFDTRFGIDNIKTRVGLEQKANLVVSKNTDIIEYIKNEKNKYKIHCILVDEVNFMSKNHIKQLRTIVTELNIPVICYGLRTNYLGQLFEGSMELFACADIISEIRITCNYCESIATMNQKLINGKPSRIGTGENELGCEEMYLPVCHKHFVTD